MSLLSLPIPPKPAVFHPNGTPPGVTPNLNALVANVGSLEAMSAFTEDDDVDCDFDGYSNFIEQQEAMLALGYDIVAEAEAITRMAATVPWYTTRPFIAPRIIVVHTNGANVEASSQSQINWGNAGASNTKAHYSVNEPTPQKLVPSNRRAIANSSSSSVENQYGVADSSFWSIAIETADMGAHRANAAGYQWPVDCGPFLHDHDELVARIIAYECIVWDIPPVFTTNFLGRGIVSHTDPFGYGHFTTVSGKTCPGRTKKDRVRDTIIPRAAQLVAAWTSTQPPVPPIPPEETEMRLIVQRDNGAIFRSSEAGGYSYVADLAGEIITAKKCGYRLVEAASGAEVTSVSHAFKKVPLSWIDTYMGPNMENLAYLRAMLIDGKDTKVTGLKAVTDAILADTTGNAGRHTQVMNAVAALTTAKTDTDRFAAIMAGLNGSGGGVPIGATMELKRTG